MRVRRRLWLKVWFALLMALFASIVFMWTGGRLLSALGPEQQDRIPAVAELVGQGLPSSPDALGPALQERAEALGLRLALPAPDGARLATTDPALPGPGARPDGSRWMRAPGGPAVVAVTLPDGRMLVGGPLRYGSGSRLHLLLPLGLLGFLALLSLPLARRVTRRLERLQAGVETLAAGDLSTRVRVEGTDEVARLADAFNLAAARIEELVARQQRMLASASHELRSPLARLRMAVELLADAESGLAPARRAELLHRAQSDVQELDGLIEDLLLVGRLGSGDPRARRDDPFDVYVLAAEEASRIGVEVDGAPAPARGDERAIRRLLRNLLENAVKHGKGEQIEVEVVPDGDTVRLAVSDRGPGVPDDQREAIFEAFHRTRDHREGEHGGVGLGLALVREIADAHGGDARCEGRPGGGSRFVVEILRERPAPEPAHRPSGSGPSCA